jgi:hypothetical protein
VLGFRIQFASFLCSSQSPLFSFCCLSFEAEYEPNRKELLRNHAMAWRTVAKKGTLKDLEQERDAATEEVTKAINKHYRRASVKVHPDRHGDKYQKEFDSLTKARDTLTDVELRKKYVEQMLQIVCKVGTHWVEKSHESWVQKHQPDVAEQHPTTKKTDRPGNQQPLQIEGGLMHTQPRKPSVVVLNRNERKIRVTLHIPGGSVYDFNTYCHAVHIMGEHTDVYNEEEYTVSLSKDKLRSKMDGTIEVDMTLPQPGIWDLRWCFSMETEPGVVVNSELSWESTVDLVSEKYKRQMELVKSFEDMARRRASQIHSAIRKLVARHSQNDHSDVQSRYSTLEEALLKGHQTEFHLAKAMEDLGANTNAANTPLSHLREALSQTTPYKKELDKELVEYEKRAALKNFKTKVYDILETGEASSWVATVSEDFLVNEMNGDPNRLYQLLMEGKKAYDCELVDAATLCAASDRKDLFTTKQLEKISERAEQVETRAAEEARQAMLENEKREAAEKARKEMEKRASIMERGVTVQIQEVKSEPTLNGTLATYMGLGNGDRYILRLNSARQIALKKHNFRRWDGVGAVAFVPARKADGWNCKTCTLLHEGPNAADLVACSMCGQPRDGQAKPNTFGASTSSNKENVSNAAGKKNSTGSKAQQNSKVGNKDPKPKQMVEATSSAKPAKQKPATSALPQQHRPINPPKQKAPQPSHLKRSTAPTPQSSAEPTFTQTQKSPQRPEPKAQQPASKAKAKPEKVKKMPRCRFGKKCKNIKSGTCRFDHTAEDIAFATGKAPSDETPVSAPTAPADPAKSPAPGSPATPATEPFASSVSDQTASLASDSHSTSFERILPVKATATRYLIGKKGSRVKDLQRRSGGAKIKIDDKVIDIMGMCVVRIRGRTAKITDKAVELVQQKLAEFIESPPNHDVISADNSSRVSSISGGALTYQTAEEIPTMINGVPKISAEKAPSSLSTEKELPKDLFAFLRSHQTSLKVSSVTFFNFLHNEDIDTLADLVEACDDEDFVSELVAKGLKRFKLAAFRKSAAAAATAHSLSM